MTIHQLHPNGPPMPVSWQDKLHAANSETEVLHVARNYVATFSPFEVSQLPEQCRPRKLADGNDLAAYAFDLVKYKNDEYAAHRLSVFFASAVQRLAQILHQQSSDSQDGQRSA